MRLLMKRNQVVSLWIINAQLALMAVAMFVTEQKDDEKAISSVLHNSSTLLKRL